MSPVTAIRPIPAIPASPAASVAPAAPVAPSAPSALSTWAILAARAIDPLSGALGAPIVQSTAYEHDAVGVNRGHAYSRVSNPTVSALEAALGRLEDAPPALAFRSGCAALAAVLFALLRPGDEILVSDVVYGGTVRLLRELLAEFGVTVRFVDTSDLDAVGAALSTRTKLVLAETPGNPTLKLTDIAGLVELCRSREVRLVVDNTFLTPILLRPLDLGADVVVHSTTKYQDGHGVSVGGAVVARDAALLERIRRVRKTLGSIQAPHEAWLTLQGLRTLELRVRRHARNALAVAQALEQLPWVARVVHPGLDSFPQRELARRLAPRDGWPGVLTVECVGGAVRAKALLERLRLIRLAEHLGSIESLATHPATMSHGDVPPAQREAAGITDGLIRISVGLEDPLDIVNDLDQAHAAAERDDALAAATVVLKFGSSVLRSGADLPLVVHEINRHRRAGRSVVAVVSAIGETTDELDELGRTSGDPSDSARALLLGTGELVAAALLDGALARAGLPSRVLDPGTLGLVTSGPTLHAEPATIDVESIRAALGAGDVVVVPGFIGRDAVDGHATLLGRGGSDLTAVAIAAVLRCGSCELLKDVDGVCEFDPSDAARASGGPPRRYATIAPDDARRVASPLVQTRAIDFAEARSVALRVRRIGGDEGTLVVAGASRFDDPAGTSDRCHRDQRRPLRVALLGAGVVGTGVLQRLLALPEWFDLRATLVRDVDQARARLGALAERAKLTSGVEAFADDGREVLGEDLDAVVELLGGVEPAGTLIESALARGIHVVTANKSLLARYGGRLRAVADASGAELLGSAAVGGAVPVLAALRQSGVHAGSRIEVALSGTCNFVLDRLRRGGTYPEAIAEAQRQGFAERDPSNDLRGVDLAEKLATIAWSIGASGPTLDVESIVREGLGTADEPRTDLATRVREAEARGRSLILIGELIEALTGPAPGTWHAKVSLREFDASDPFASLRGPEVAARWLDREGCARLLRGRGAGRWPTTEAVIGDLLELRTGVAIGRDDVGALVEAGVR